MQQGLTGWLLESHALCWALVPSSRDEQFDPRCPPIALPAWEFWASKGKTKQKCGLQTSSWTCAWHYMTRWSRSPACARGTQHRAKSKVGPTLRWALRTIKPRCPSFSSQSMWFCVWGEGGTRCRYTELWKQLSGLEPCIVKGDLENLQSRIFAKWKTNFTPKAVLCSFGEVVGMTGAALQMMGQDTLTGAVGLLRPSPPTSASFSSMRTCTHTFPRALSSIIPLLASSQPLRVPPAMTSASLQSGANPLVPCFASPAWPCPVTVLVEVWVFAL